MKLLIVCCLLLSSCGSPVKCIDGKMAYNINPLLLGNIYEPSDKDCIETD